MQKGSLVKYIGGQCEFGKLVYPLSKEEVYTISGIYLGLFLGQAKGAVTLEEADGYGFIMNMFEEIQPPITSEEILEAVEENVVLQD